jgi:hypothetical protein
LNKEGRELANAVARKIHRKPPDDVDPDNLCMADVLKYLQDTDGSDGDTALLTELLQDGLDYQQAIYWYLWKYAGLSPKEIHLAETGREHVQRWDDERPEVRSVEATLTAAGRLRGRKGHVSDWDRNPDSDQSAASDGR